MFGVIHSSIIPVYTSVKNDTEKVKGFASILVLFNCLENIIKSVVNDYCKMKGLSHALLAKASGVSIRSIQLFEQRRSNINNVQYNHLRAIAKVLGCNIENLLE